MSDPTPTIKQRAVSIACDAHRIYGQRDDRPTEGHDGALAEYAEDQIREAVAAERERLLPDIQVCIEWLNAAAEECTCDPEMGQCQPYCWTVQASAFRDRIKTKLSPGEIVEFDDAP